METLGVGRTSIAQVCYVLDRADAGDRWWVGQGLQTAELITTSHLTTIKVMCIVMFRLVPACRIE